MMMFGDPYGDNGIIDPKDESLTGEEESFTRLAQRWNAKQYNVARTPDAIGFTAGRRA